MDTVIVETGSRLHFGPLAWRSKGRSFGGIGMMIDEPQTSVKAVAADRFSVDADAPATRRIEALLAHWEPSTSRRFAVRVSSAAPRHRGYGSGTQLACAVATAVLHEHDANGPTATELASWTDRGARSAIGIHGFCSGGFLVDAGKDGGVLGSLAAREEFPSDWTILLDEGSGDGISGDRETAAFRDLAPMPERLTGRLCDLVLRGVLPGIADSDFESFASALTEYGWLAGEFFQPAQGGVFAGPSWETRCKAIRAEVPAAVVQSSWGPTVAVIVSNPDDAERVRAICPDRSFREVECRNTGATISIKT